MLNQVKESVYKTNKRLLTSNLVIQNFGNGSQRIDNKFIIKPSGIDLDKYEPKDMCEIDSKTGKNLSALKPSTDEPTHRVLYKKFKEIGGIVHTHSLFATSFAQALKPIVNFGTTHSDFSVTSIPCTDPLKKNEVENGYEENTGNAIITKIEELNINPQHLPGILVAGHGVFSWGEDIEVAFKNAEAIEFIAKLAFNTLSINPKSKEIEDYISLLHHTRKHGPESYYGQN